MFRLIFPFLFCAAIAGPVVAQDATGNIRSIISQQIEAFERDDLDRAFSFASPTIKRLFGSPERFGHMVEHGYPMVWRPSDIRFAAAEERDGRSYQVVVFRDSAGKFHALEYEMLPLADGWKINGVRFVPLPDVGV